MTGERKKRPLRVVVMRDPTSSWIWAVLGRDGQMRLSSLRHFTRRGAEMACKAFIKAAKRDGIVFDERGSER